MMRSESCAVPIRAASLCSPLCDADLDLADTRWRGVQQLLASECGEAKSRRAAVKWRQELGRDSDRRRVLEEARVVRADAVDASSLFEQRRALRALEQLETDQVAHFAGRDDVIADRSPGNQHRG